MAAVSHLKNKKEARMRGKLDKVLSRCSLSSGGNISVKQFLEVLESAGVEPNDREVSKLERMSDESGEIERETFTAYAKKSEAFKEYMEAERKSGIDKAEIAFKAIDRDNSGYITMAELGKLGTKMNQKKTEALMAKLDADGDGKITLEEFRELFKHK